MSEGIAFSILRLDSIPSSNDYVLERIRQGVATPGMVCVAREQSGARGRQGRQWIAAEGGLWFTAAMPRVGAQVGWGGMIAALAVCQALEPFGLQAGVKWPNDVVIGARKLAGVLVEAVAGRELLAVGVGLNVRNPLPQATDDRGQSTDVAGHAPRAWPPTSVQRETGQDLDPEALLEPLLARMGALWQDWAAGRLAELHAGWSARDVCRGRPVALLPDGPRGVAHGIDLSGALQVRLADGAVQRAVAGEIVFID